MLASPGASDGASKASSSSSSSRDITTSCKLHDATSITSRELQEITDNFSEGRAIGEGAYGKVYKGALDNGEEIAVKLLHNRLETDDVQFRRELENLMRLKHHNIVRLVGYCYETQHKPMQYMGQTCYADEISKALCFEYMQNGSLEKHLSDECDGLDWDTRYKIIKGTCEGLKYLHEGFEKPIYHLDLKPDNILLDENMVPKLADFGLSRIFDEQQTMITKSTFGTFGYMPPEYLNGNIVSKKLDVFSMGVVMIKIVAGPSGHTRKAQMSRQDFLDQVHENWRNRLKETLSSPEQLEAHCEQVKTCTEIALRCMKKDRHKRPSILDIIHELNGTEDVIDKVVPLHESTPRLDFRRHLTSDGLSIPQLLNQISNNAEASSLKKQETLQQLVKASLGHDSSNWPKYFNQILTAALDDSDSSTRELGLSLIAEMLNNQKDAMEEFIEIILEKLLDVTKDVVEKISNEANQCIDVLLAKYDPFRCLAVIVPLLVSDDEKTLVASINCLTKLVGHLSKEELTNQLLTFLPELFVCFSNQSPDVRKAAVFCLVDIYIMLGKAFVPYLEELSSTQVRLVTIYANRISQARNGTPIDADQ